MCWKFQRRCLIGQHRWLSFFSEEDCFCNSETTKDVRRGENICLLIESGYSKQEGVPPCGNQKIVGILVRSVSPYREEPLKRVYN